MPLFGSKRMGRARALPPTPYGTRDPAKIIASAEAAQGQPTELALLEGPAAQSAVAPPLSSAGATAMPAPRPNQGGALFGRPRQAGFDYDAARQALMGNQKKPEWWQYGLAVLGDALSQHQGAGGPSAVAALNQRAQAMRSRAQAANSQIAEWQYEDWSRQHEAALRASDPFTIGRDRLQYDPYTGQTSTLFDGLEDHQLYASHLGLEPDTPEYFRAVEDHVLRSSGPSAHERDMEIDDYRTGNDERMEGIRFDNRRRLEGIRQSNRLEVARNRRGNSGRRTGRGSGDNIPTISTPAEASQLPSGTRFRTPDGRVKVAR